MTILAVKNQLISHFFSHDTFEFNRHQLEVIFDKETVDFREQLTIAALDDLERIGIVKKMAKETRVMWVLAQPIHSFQQQVIIGPMVAERVAGIINFVNEMEEIDIICDKTKIVEGDLLRLVGIVEDSMDIDGDEDQAPKVPGNGGK